MYLRVKVGSSCHAPSGVRSQATLRDLAFFFFFFFFWKPTQVQGVVTLGFGAAVEVPESWLKSICGDFDSGQSDLEVIPVLRSPCYIN